MVKAVIFDVDGTLVDSVDVHARAWVDAFADFGHTVEFDAVRGQIGKGGDQLLPVFLTQAEIEANGQDLEAHRARILKDRYMSSIKPFPGVRALFERLRADGLVIALASSAKQEELQTYKRIAHIDDLVGIETSADDADRSKPNPDIFDAALRRLGPDIPASQAVAVGDTPYDAEAAGQAGVRCIGLLCGGWPEDKLREAGCVAIYADPADLLAGYTGSVLAT